MLIIAQMPSVNLDKALEKVRLVRWKAHDDWVEHITIDKRLNQIISCSNDEYHAVIIGNHEIYYEMIYILSFSNISILYSKQDA